MSKTRQRRDAGAASLFLVLDQKSAYRQIRNYLAGQFIGATRDETLLQEVIKTLFCKLYIKKRGNSLPHSNANGTAVAEQYKQAFTKVCQFLPATFNKDDELLLNAESIAYVDSLLESADVDDPASDPIGDAYEAFIGSSVRGQEGQFFTPQNGN